MEPYEQLLVDVPESAVGGVMELLGQRKADLVNMVNNGTGQVRMEFIIPARGLIGFRTEFLTETRGYGTMNHSFAEYRPMKGVIQGRRQGVLVASETGTATAYGIEALEDRGVMFITPGTEVYEGMIVGEHTREQDLTVNPCKEKHMSNMRSATKDEAVRLKAPRLLSLDQALEYLNDDEYCEVTPTSVRLRKKFLKKAERERQARQKQYASETK